MCGGAWRTLGDRALEGVEHRLHQRRVRGVRDAQPRDAHAARLERRRQRLDLGRAGR